MNTTTLAPAVPRSAAQTARLVLSLFKLRIGTLIMVTALVGMAVTPGNAPSLLEAAVLALTVLGASAAVGALNQYLEVDSDRLMARTRRRAFASGALPHRPAWLLLIAALLVVSVGTAWWVLNAAAAGYIFLGAFFYGVVYTMWLKRRSWTNIVVGGLSGSFAVLAGAAVVDPTPGALPMLLALVLFLWTPPHFWSLAIAGSADYAAAGVPMLPVVVGPQRAARAVFASTAALVAASLLPGWFGAGPVYLAGAAIGGGWFLAKSWRLALTPSRQTAMGAFFASLLQLSLLLGAASIDGLIR